MEPPTQEPDARQLSGLLKRIHQFGSSTEQLFNRLYYGLTQRAQDEDQQQAQSDIEKRNRKLRRMLHKSSMKVERLEAILSAISEGIVLQDLEGRVRYINDAARELLGSERNLWQSEIVSLFSAYQGVQRVGSELAPLGQPYRLKIRDKLASAQLAAVADSTGERIGTLIILRLVEPDAAARMKASLVSRISHELRTPLASLRLASEVLNAAPPEKAPNRKMLEMISRNIDILDRMVHEMIDLAAITDGTLTLRREPVPMEDMLVDLYDEFKEDIAEAHLEMQLYFKDIDQLTVLGDRKYIRWALSNVLRNSIQYNEPGHQVFVRARLREAGGQALVAVQIGDTGVGISDEDLPHIFDLFYRGKPRTSAGKLIDPRGLGQGLYVARTLTEAHGGTLDAESRPGEGSIFTFLLPVSLNPALDANTAH
jgi:signal transduction histidine kinase